MLDDGAVFEMAATRGNFVRRVAMLEHTCPVERDVVPVGI